MKLSSQACLHYWGLLFHQDNPQPEISGFTIVEVMIVLAIAGLILAVVFVAVPALQRNQRNTSRQGDIAYLRATLDTSIANNGGRLDVDRFISSGKASELARLGDVNRSGLNIGKTGAVCIGRITGGNTDGSDATKCANSGESAPITAGVWHTSNIIAPPLNSILVASTLPTSPSTITWGNDNNDEVLVVVNHRCLVTSDELVATTGATTSNTAVLLGTSGSGNAAWLYKLEGEPFLNCVDDVN